jgi:uncharacterized protein YjbI with pentapeptide repeats
MKGGEWVKRWSDPQFASGMEDVFRSMFVLRNPARDLDLRGLVVGLDGALPSVTGLSGLRLENVDLSEARLSCSLSKAHIQGTKLARAYFDTCYFKGAKFVSCDFGMVRFDSPTLDDATFLDCSFREAKMTGRGSREYGGRRFVFERCDFNGAVLRNVQLRAGVFRECSFHGTVFKKGLLVAVKFEGGAPAEESFVGCELERVRGLANDSG